MNWLRSLIGYLKRWNSTWPRRHPEDDNGTYDTGMQGWEHDAR